ncbi:MAG TPA: sugar transferase [Acidimicrobiia bacterium]|nr:sugar transferase [Acidimicrobiia bacterium]
MPEGGLTTRQAALKRVFDLVVASAGIVATWPVMLLTTVLATVDTRRWGIFTQLRVGRNGELFEVMKVRTMRTSPTVSTTVTAKGDARITRLGGVLRSLKLDELPQLINVVRGEMSLVGPRPDVPGFADRLEGEDRVILSVRPGITGPAALAYRREEEMLAAVDDPERYNREVIWPDKVRISRQYVASYSLMGDIRCIRDTIASVLDRKGEIR